MLFQCTTIANMFVEFHKLWSFRPLFDARALGVNLTSNEATSIANGLSINPSWSGQQNNWLNTELNDLRSPPRINIPVGAEASWRKKKEGMAHRKVLFWLWQSLIKVDYAWCYISARHKEAALGQVIEEREGQKEIRRDREPTKSG